MMTAQNKRILAKSISFGQPPFRKLTGLTLDLADRITLIAGHNGIGKTTILGLLANTFGIRGDWRNYFGDQFYANIERIVYLALQEAEKAKEQGASGPIVTAKIGNLEIKKRCALTQRKDWNRARVVPRTVDKSPEDPVGPDAKIPLPTLFLGVRRLASIGEADEREVGNSALDMADADRQLMVDFVQSVIQGIQVNDNVTETVIKGSKKRSAHPGYIAHDSLAISMGQDSLGSIATALASFNRLKRDQGDDYVGGLLIIDELDVGFHPHAIERLAKSLKTYARQLDLQVIATTHSPILIEQIHPEGGGNTNSPDGVIYLLDTARPRIAEDQTLQAILSDMALRDLVPPTTTKPVLGIYFEDAEGVTLFNSLVPSAKRAALGRKYGVRLKPIGLGVGGSNLLQLPDHDPLFKDRVLVVDGDTTLSSKAKNRGNSLKFPCPTGATGTDRSPENMIINFIKGMIAANDGPFHDSMRALNVSNPSTDKLRAAFCTNGRWPSGDRVSTKKWWADHWPTLRSWKVLERWADLHKNEVQHFADRLEEAIRKTSTRLRS